MTHAIETAKALTFGMYMLLFSIDYKLYNFDNSARNTEDIKLFAQHLLLADAKFPPGIQHKINCICTAYCSGNDF